MENAIIKKNIYRKRIEKGYSQSQIASMMKISQTSYQKIEKGDTSLVSGRLIQLAAILDLTEAELVLGYLPEEKKNSQKLEELQRETLLNESSLRENFGRILAEKERRIEELEEIIKDKNEIISLQRDLLNQLPK